MITKILVKIAIKALYFAQMKEKPDYYKQVEALDRMRDILKNLEQK